MESLCFATLNYNTIDEAGMVLGEILGEVRGKVAGLKALGDGKVEISLQGEGKLLGADVSDIVTFWSVMRPNGTAHGQGNSIDMSADGMAEWKGSGVGRMTAPGAWKYSYGGVFTNVTTEKWARLLDCFTVGEYEADASGNYRWKLWEWKF